MASLCMQARQFVLLPPWGTIKILDLQRAHFSTAKTTPPREVMSLEIRSDYLSSWCNSGPCGETERSWLHKKIKWLGMSGYLEFKVSQKRQTSTYTHTHLQHPSVMLTNQHILLYIKTVSLGIYKNTWSGLLKSTLCDYLTQNLIK